MKTLIPYRLIILLIAFISVGNISEALSQVSAPFVVTETQDNVRGNLIQTGNDIVGLIRRNGTNFNANDPTNVTFNNGDYTTAFIDVDGDPTTFSSSEARLSAPREDCSTLVYAGLYWSANYYIQRGDNVIDYTNNQINSSTNTNTALIINNGTLAQEYTVRNSEFGDDNSNIETAAVTSYLVVSQPANGCGITNAAQLAGNIAVVQEGGSCSNREKVINAQNAGAIGVVIVSSSNRLPRLTGNGPTITIPSVSIGNDDITNANVTGQNLVNALNAQTEVVLGTLSTTGGDRINGLSASDPRKRGPADFRNIKFKVPGGTYVDITAQETVFDGYRNTIFTPGDTANDELPYVCYAEVTNLLDPDNPFGTYTVADMNATQGYTPGGDGACGGWVLVAIYEDPLESAKYISISDGFAQISRGDPPVDFDYSGFTTLQGTQPVEARYGVASLEGDKSLTGDALSIENTLGVFTPLGNGTNVLGDVNPTNNFFNGSISIDDVIIPDRTPNSTNTLGFDADLFELPNNGNVLIGNNQTSATFRLSTNGDRFSVFYNAFSVTIIEPELRITKRVYDDSGVLDITDANVNPGDELFYELEIENIGNEIFVDGQVTITDVLPANTDLLGVEDATLPPGVTYFEVSPGVLQFDIPRDLVETFNDNIPGGDLPIFIRFRAQLVATCEDLRDACSDVISNQATATYIGAVSGTVGNTASSSAIGACGDGSGTASNILVNVPPCTFEVTFCNDELTLVAGTGYDSYTWSGPGISPPETTNSNIYPVANPQSGVYSVVKEDTNPADGTCMTLTEEFDVTAFREIENPVLDYVNGTTVYIETCGSLDIPQILLCGDQDFLIETDFAGFNLESISWQRLNASGSCLLDPNDPCSLLDGNCTDTNWVEEAGGNTNDFTVSEAGDYRIQAEFDGGCVIDFYFSVYKNDYQPVLTMNLIECGNDGSVTVTNVPDDFAFSLTSGGPYTNTTGVFPISTAGDVTVYAIDTTFSGCEYSATINVPESNPIFVVDVTNPSCASENSGDPRGTISIGVSGGNEQYYYEISGGALVSPIVVPNNNDPNFTSTGLQPGTYDIRVISNRPAPECVYDDIVTINPPTEFRARVEPYAPATCDTGALVQIIVEAGSGDYLYDDGSGNFIASNIFEIPNPDPATTYTFYVSDQTVPAGTPACIITADITGISPYEAFTIDTITPIDPVCPNEGGQVRVEISPEVTGRTYLYELLRTATCDVNDTIYTQIAQISSPLDEVTFPNVPAYDCYHIRVSHENTTPPGTTPPTICPIIEGPFAIEADAAIDATVITQRELSCVPGSEDAIIQITTASGGTGNFAWSFNPTSGYTNITSFPVNIPVTTAGNYTIYIANQGTPITCAISRDVVVADLLEVDSVVITPNDSNCTTQTIDVTLSATPSPLPTPAVYTYRVTPDPASNTGNTGFVATTTYTFTNGVSYLVEAMRSDSQCTNSDSFFQDEIDEIEITSAGQTEPVTCIGDNDGEFSFTVSNSTSFQYIITDAGSVELLNATATGTDPVTVVVNGIPLIAGTYTIEVIDQSIIPAANNCTATTTVTIAEPTNQITFTPEIVSQDCITGTNTVGVSGVSGGNGPAYTYELFDSLGVSQGPSRPINQTYTNVPNGTGYYIVVTDSEACPFEGVPFNINALPAITVTIPTSELCLDDGIVTLDVVITGGTPDYSYRIERNGTPVIGDTALGAGVTTFTTPDLTQEGSYEVFITDAAGCIGSVIQVVEPAVNITATFVKHITCDAGNSPTDAGEISLSVAGGYATYDIDYSTDGGGTYTNYVTAGNNPFANFTTTTAGTYIFQVTDSEGCTHTSQPIQITEPLAPTITANDITLLCDGDTGTIEVTVTGVDPDYEIAFGPAPFTPTNADYNPITASSTLFPNLGEGVYDIFVRDSSGCVYTEDVEVITPDPITYVSDTVTGVTCGGLSTVTDLGEIVLEITGGTANYTFNLVRAEDLLTFPYVWATTDPSTPNPRASSGVINFEGLDFGQYYIIAEDANGCTETFGVFDVFSELGAVIPMVTVTGSCPDGVIYDIEITQGQGINPPTNPPPGFDIRIVGEPSPGLGDFIPLNDEPLNATVVDANTPIRFHRYGGGGAFGTLEFERAYIIEIRDNVTNCLYQQLVPPEPLLSAPAITNVVVTDVTCNETPALGDGSISFDISGYDPSVTQVSWEVFDQFTNESLDITYTPTVYSGSQGGLTGADVPVTIINIPQGQYYVVVREDDGTQCPSRFDFVIETPEAISAALDGQTEANCNTNATVVINTSGGTPFAIPPTDDGYTYELVATGAVEPATPFSLNSNTIDIGAVDGEVQDIWVADANGCTFGPITVTTVLTPGPTVTVPPFVDNFCDDDTYTFDVTGTATVVNAAGNIFYGIDDATDATDPIIFTEAPPGTFTFTVPTSGTYTITVQDANGCIDTDTMLIYPPVDITAAFTTITGNCRDADNIITTTIVSPGSGAANQTFDLVDATTMVSVVPPVVNAGGGVFQQVPPGDYIVVITDTGMGATACTDSFPVSLTIPEDPAPTTDTTPVSCSGRTDGSITVTLAPTDTDSPYTYQLFNYNAVTMTTGTQVGGDQIDDGLFDNLPAGDYQVVVTADTNCSVTREPVNVGTPTVLDASATASTYACAPADTPVLPEITVTIVGGTPPYSVSYTGPSSSGTDVDVTDADPAAGVQYVIPVPIGGTYTIDVTDDNNCAFATITEIIPDFPVLLNPTVTLDTPLSCTAGEFVTVRVEGGTGAGGLYDFVETSGTGLSVLNVPYTTLDDAGTAPVETGAVFELPSVGIYQFEITDQTTGCTVIVAHEVEAFEEGKIIADEETPETCFEGQDGRINITISDYVGTFDYTVIDVATGIEAVDILGNPIPTATGTITTTTDPETVVLPFTGTVGNYQIQIVQQAAPFCTRLSDVVPITGPPVPFEISFLDVNPVEFCDPAANGAFQVNYTGAQGTVSFAAVMTTTPFTVIPPNTTGLFEGLAAGDYEVTATDDNGAFVCTDVETYTIAPPADDVGVTLIPFDSSCYEAADGRIEVTATGTDVPFLYTITVAGGTESGTQTVPEFGPLTPGTYTINVYDKYGCTNSSTTTITEPAEVIAEVVSVEEIQCNETDVDVVIRGITSAVGGIVEYFVVDVNGVETSNGNNPNFTLGEGTYQFYVVDADGCRSDLVGPVVVIPIDPITIDLDTDFANINCFNEETGRVDATVRGGIGEYRFVLTNTTTSQVWPAIGTQTSSEFTDLPAGDYIYRVEADRNCFAEANFTIINPDEFENIEPEVTDVLCFGEDNGSVIVFAAGGTPDYSFSIRELGSTDIVPFFGDDTDNDPNQHTFTMLAPGDYEVVAQDLKGCSQVYEVTIGEPDQLMIDPDDVLILPETCLGDNDGSVSIIVTGGSGVYFTNITNNDSDFAEGVFTYDMQPGGPLTIYVRDENNCRIDITVDIPNGVDISATLVPALDCPEYDPITGNLIQPAIYYVDFLTTGVDINNTDITYILESVNGDPAPIQDTTEPTRFIVQPNVVYQGSVEHTLGCVRDLGTITVDDYTPLSTPIAEMTGNPEDPNEYEISVTGGSGEYLYYIAMLPDDLSAAELEQALAQLTDADYTLLDSNIFSLRETANYVLRVVDNEIGCQIDIIQRLTYINIAIPNYFTPNGDGTDDLWYPYQIFENDPDPSNPTFFFDDMEVKVFDRYGRMLAEFIGDQGPDGGWDGIYQGKELPSGDYWFTIILNDIDNREFTGHFTLYR
ncbi:T9SS type B sorting domain-containing protein [Aquimarina addita]